MTSLFACPITGDPVLKAPGASNDLVGYWPLDERGGDIAFDRSPHGEFEICTGLATLAITLVGTGKLRPSWYLGRLFGQFLRHPERW